MLKIFFSSGLQSKYFLRISLKNARLLSFNTFDFGINNHCCDDPHHNHHNHGQKTEGLKINNINETSKPKFLKLGENFDENELIKSLEEIKKFNDMAKHQGSMRKIYNIALDNLEKINGPQAIFLLMSLSIYLPVSFLNEENKKNIAKKALQILSKADSCKRDEGAFLAKFIVMEKTIKFVENQLFYYPILKTVQKKLDFISIKNQIVILEGIYIQEKEKPKKDLCLLFLKCFEIYQNLGIGYLDNYANILSLVFYVKKNKVFSDYKEEEDKLFLIFDKILKNFCNRIIDVLKSPIIYSNTIFSIVLFMNVFKKTIQEFPNENNQFLFELIDKSLNLEKVIENKTKIDLDIKKIKNFLFFFRNSKPIYLPQPVLKLIQNNFLQLTWDIANMNFFTSYLNFLLANSKDFEISEKNHEFFLKIIPDVKSVDILIRILDIYRNCLDQNKIQRNNKYFVEIVEMIETQAITQMKSNFIPPFKIFGLFYILSFLEKGKLNTWLWFFNYFSNVELLRKVEIHQIIKRLLPIAAFKTKREFKLTTNIPRNMSNVVDYLQNVPHNNEFIQAIEIFWQNLEDYLVEIKDRIHIDRYPKILMHFVYGNITFRKFTKIFHVLAPVIIKNIKSFNINEISVIFYCYARLDVTDTDELVECITKELKNLLGNHSLQIEKAALANIHWSFSKKLFFDSSLLNLIENLFLDKKDQQFDYSSFAELINSISFFVKIQPEKLEKFSDLLVKNKEQDIDISHCFLIAYSFLCLELKSERAWSVILNKIIKKINESSSIQIYYLYLIFVHLTADQSLSNSLQNELKILRQKISTEKNRIIDYLVYKKAKRSSEEEIKIMEHAKKTVAKILGKDQSDSDTTSIVINNENFVFVDSLKDINKTNLVEHFPEKIILVPYTADFRMNKFIFEHNGKFHYFFDLEKKQREINGITRLKRRFLEQLGFVYVEIPFDLEKEEDVERLIAEKSFKMRAFESIFPKTYNKPNRTIILNEISKKSEFVANRIKTSKYNLLNFFPKCLFLQFMRVANFYFLATAVVQSISIISPLAPFSAIAPLVFVLVVSLIREAIDDIKRHRNDYKTNLQKANILNVESENENEFSPVYWKDLMVGNFVKINNGEVFPADLLLLQSSDEMGVCYVETSNLDGERNLKCKQSIEIIRKEIQDSSLKKLHSKIVYENPNNMIHHFKGMVYMKEADEPVFLNNDQVLLRGTSLKNTDWIIGLVIYTGADSKIMKNQGVLRHKTTHIETRLNKIAVWILILQAILCVILAILSAQFTAKHNEYYGAQYPSEYIFYEPIPADSWSPELTGLISYFSFFLLLNTMIPISLIVSLEVIKVLQSLLIEFDREMYYEPYKIRCKVLNTMIHEEMGKIEYIFADKTGTLTSNNMEFKRCSINLIEFSIDSLCEMCTNEQALENYLENCFTVFEQRKKFYEFFFALALCHDVLVDHSIANSAVYQGSSPDEITLVNVAKTLNFEFKKRSMNQISMDFFGKNMTFELLAKLDFTSERKRMSVIVRHPISKKIMIYCKGADSIILARVAKSLSQNEMIKSKEYLKLFSKEGLRTLCVANAEISEQKFNEWLQKYQAALKKKNSSKNSEEDKQIEHEIAQIEGEIENDMDLLGITAVEDKLQEGVPEVIQNLHEAGINIWMLTGDKLETAENIGYLCSLITKETKKKKNKSAHFERALSKIEDLRQGKILKKQTKSLNENEEEKQGYVSPANQPRIESRLSSFNNANVGIGTVFPEKETPTKNTVNSFGLIIEGDVINQIFASAKYIQDLLKIIPYCRTVICCRSTPNQKAEIVKFMKNSLKKVTLAIGDGGNDVNMIQTADIGVGIYGKEGNQAATCADYSFCQFRYLWRLLLVHGRWSYLRNSFFIKFFFYKNIFFTFQQMWFAIYSAFSAQTFWDDGYLLNFNSVVTCFAPACYALFEQDVNPKESEAIKKALPNIYKTFRKKDLFSYGNFIYWFIKGLIQSVIIFYVCLYTTDLEAIKSDGFVNSLWGFSVLAYSCTFAVIMLELFIETSNYTVVVHFFYWILAIFLYFPIFVYVWNVFSSPVQYYANDFFIYGKFWLIVIVTMGICGGAKYVFYTSKKLFSPDEVDKLQIFRFFLKKEYKQKQNEIQKKIEIIKKHSKNASKNGQEIEMDNLAKDSEGPDLIAYEPQSSEKRNTSNYKFFHNHNNHINHQNK